MVSFKYGCSIHKWKSDKLVRKLPPNLEEALAANKKNGLLGEDARTIEDQATEEAGEDDEDDEMAADGQAEEDLNMGERDTGEAGAEAEPIRPQPDAPRRRRRRANEE